MYGLFGGVCRVRCGVESALEEGEGPGDRYVGAYVTG